jgi:hypothetical protein
VLASAAAFERRVPGARERVQACSLKGYAKPVTAYPM